jgi:hypothetical protein
MPSAAITARRAVPRARPDPISGKRTAYRVTPAARLARLAWFARETVCRPAVAGYAVVNP